MVKMHNKCVCAVAHMSVRPYSGCVRPYTPDLCPMLIFKVFLSHMKVCGHHMKVCGRTPSKDEEHMKNAKNTMGFKLRFRCFTSNKLIDGGDSRS